MARMVRLNRIYTRTGDDGTTGLADGTRVPKHALRIECYGTVDELNSVLGLAARSSREETSLTTILARVQNDLFDLGADLSTPGEEGLRITQAQVDALEHDIDRLNQQLQPLESFVLPGGSELAAWLHVARTVCRRAERAMVLLAAQEPLTSPVIPYVNRLSDLLFVMARWANGRGEDDVLWVPGKHR
jgi:cob(I)alamin adenosyltransferase